MNSLVSICIPTFNGATYLREALKSAVNQTYTNVEIVVSDDASSDDTISIVKEFASTSKIPFYIYTHQPKGIGANWNHSIIKSNGKYIKFLFQDDILEPTCIEKMVQVFESDSSIGLVASKRKLLIDEDYISESTKKWMNKYKDLQASVSPLNPEKVTLFNKTLFKHENFFKSPFNKIGEPTVFMFSRAVFNKVGEFREDLKQSLDYEFCYRVLKQHQIAVINESLVQFRLHNLQATNVNRTNNYDDYDVYMDEIFKNYFWLINTKQKLHLLKKRYKLVAIVFKIKAKLHL